MKKEVLEYFNDLDMVSSLPKFKKTPSINCDRVEETDVQHGLAKMYHIDGKPYFLKRALDDFSVGAIASSEMYKDMEITTPQIHLMTNETPVNIFDYLKSKSSKKSKPIFTATKDATSVPGYTCVIGSHIKDFIDIRDNYGFYINNKWQILYDKQLKALFLQFMTPECLEEYIRLFILDELRTDTDRHTDNFILYKRDGADRFEGVIPFDLETQRILMDKIKTDGDFKSFLNQHYITVTPLSFYDEENYETRVNNLIDSIQKGMDKETIGLLKKEIAYDMPKKILEICKNPYFKKYKDSTYDAYSRLWEYNRNTIGKELGL